MKLLKSKFAAALVLAGLMFGMFSFSTTPVAAQDTYSEDVIMTDTETAALPAVVAAAFIRGALWGAAAGLAYRAYKHFTGDNQVATGDVPTDALDY